MKRENLTMFDLEAAFKALDEIEMPVAEKGIRANKVNIQETFKVTGASKTDLLLEDYYDISDTEDLEQAKADREAEVAKAKLARIEKIVDLAAESEEDLLPSYVGKVIIQCPQCMTLFYKEEADIVKSETDEETVNVAEVCQHCGNESGYTLIGKVEGVNEEELMPEENVEEIPAEEENLDLEPVEEVEETSEEGEEDLDLAPVEDNEEPEEEKEEEEVVEESLQLNEETQNKLTENIAEADFNKIISTIKQDLIQAFDFGVAIEDGEFYEEDGFKDIYVEWEDFDCESEEFEAVVNWIKANENKYEGFKLNLLDEEDVDFITINVYAKEALTEAVDKELQAKLDAHNEYIKFLQEEIEKEEKALEAAKNDFIKEAIQRRLDALKEDLEKALPEEVKNEVVEEEAPVEEKVENEIPVEEKVEEEIPAEEQVVEEAPAEEKEEVKEALNEGLTLVEDAETEQKLNAVEAELENSNAEDYIVEEKELKESPVIDALTELENELTDESLTEDNKAKYNVSDEDFRAMLKNPVFNEGCENCEDELKEELPSVPDAPFEKAVDRIENAGEKLTPEEQKQEEAELAAKEAPVELENAEDFDEKGFNESVNKYLTNTYENVKCFEATNCKIENKKLVVEGVISFNSGKARKTTFEFEQVELAENKIVLNGTNQTLAEAFVLTCGINEKTLITEGFNKR